MQDERRSLGILGWLLLCLLPISGCGPAALLVMTIAGGAAAVSGEPQRMYGTQGQDFDERRVARVRSGVDTQEDVVNLFGQPQTKVYTGGQEEWVYRYYVPPTMLRPGMEKVLTIRFREGRVEDLRYSISAL